MCGQRLDARRVKAGALKVGLAARTGEVAIAVERRANAADAMAVLDVHDVHAASAVAGIDGRADADRTNAILRVLHVEDGALAVEGGQRATQVDVAPAASHERIGVGDRTRLRLGD